MAGKEEEQRRREEDKEERGERGRNMEKKKQ